MAEDRLRKWAAGMILDTPDLADELTDDEARPLLAWGVAQAEAAARQAAVPEQAAAALAGDDLQAALSGRLSPVRRVMKAINSLAADRRQLEAAALVEELQYVVELAGRLPNPPRQVVDAPTLADLAARQVTMDNGAFVQALLALLAGDLEPEKRAPQPNMEAGERDDEKEKVQPEDPAERGDLDYSMHRRLLPPPDHRGSGPWPV